MIQINKNFTSASHLIYTVQFADGLVSENTVGFKSST